MGTCGYRWGIGGGLGGGQVGKVPAGSLNKVGLLCQQQCWRPMGVSGLLQRLELEDRLAAAALGAGSCRVSGRARDGACMCPVGSGGAGGDAGAC